MASISEMISEVETTETKQDDVKPVAGMFDIQDILSGYKEPAKIEPLPVTEQTKPPQQQPEQPKVNEKFPGMPHWYGNPMYYQSGKKQGQIKPPPKNGTFKAAFQQPQVSVNPETTILTADSIISGALFLTIINVLIPMLMAMVHNMVVKDKKKIIEWEMLQIDAKAQKDLEGLAEKALKQIKIDANPVGILIFAMLGMYAMQFMTVKMMVNHADQFKDMKK